MQESYSMQKLKELTNGATHPMGNSLLKNNKHEEGFPSGVYLGLAAGAMAISAVLAATSERKGLANFVGLWAPSLLMLGIYNKIVNTQGNLS
jgi:hypothetical protein